MKCMLGTVAAVVVAVIQVGCSGTEDIGQADGPLGQTDAPMTVQIASTGAATGRLMQGFKCSDTAGIACDTGTTCAPSRAVCLPTQLFFFCSDDPTISAALVAAREELVALVGQATYGIGVDPVGCRNGDNVIFQNVAVTGSFPSNDIRAYTRMVCAGSNAIGTATVPFSGSSSPTYNLRACTTAVIDLDLTKMNNRGANATEDANFLKYAVRHYMAAYMGAGSHSSTYNTTASYNIFNSLSSVPAFLSSGEQCRIKKASLAGGAVFSTAGACVNN